MKISKLKSTNQQVHVLGSSGSYVTVLIPRDTPTRKGHLGELLTVKQDKIYETGTDYLSISVKEN